MELDPDIAMGLCRAAHGRLLASVSSLDDSRMRAPSRLPGWSVGHVITHLARNADGHVRRLEAALRGQETPRYPGGQAQRNRDIEAGAGRPAEELATDLRLASERLEAVWVRSAQDGWPHADLLAGDHFPTTGSPTRRLREVEVHHVDLGLGYTADSWAEEYVQWELQASLERLPRRFSDARDARRFLAWLTGRAEWPEGVRLTPWL